MPFPGETTGPCLECGRLLTLFYPADVPVTLWNATRLRHLRDEDCVAAALDGKRITYTMSNPVWAARAKEVYDDLVRRAWAEAGYAVVRIA